MTLLARILKARKILGPPNDKLAKKLGIVPDTLYRIKRGEAIKELTAKRIERRLKRLGV